MMVSKWQKKPDNTMTSAQKFINEYIDAWLVERELAHATYQQTYLIALVKCADFHAHLITMKPHPALLGDSRFILLGIGMLLSKFLRYAENCRENVHSGHSNFWLECEAEKDLIVAGKLFHIQRLAALEPAGLIESRSLSDTHFSIHKIIFDLETLERQDEDWLVDHYRKGTQVTRLDLNRRINERLSSGIQEYVTVNQGVIKIEKFDGELFRMIKEQTALSWLEYNESSSFPDDVTIGSRTFGEWRDICITAAANLAIYRHYAVVVQKESIGGKHNIRELLTQWTDDIANSGLFQEGPNDIATFNSADVRDAFFMDAEDAEWFYSEAEVPLPYGVKIGNYLLMPQFGVLGNISFSMVSHLRRNFLDDWLAMVAARESAFQVGLKDLFKDKGYEFGKWNLDINTDFGKTDTDGAIYEHGSNCLYIFQLKCPDIWARSLKQRRNRLSSLVKDGNPWINKLDWWIRNTPNKNILAQLELDLPDISIDNMKIRLVMLSRSDTRISAEEDQYDRRAAWTSWARLQRLVLESKTPRLSLAHAWAQCIKPDELKYIPVGKVTIFQFKNLRVDVHE